MRILACRVLAAIATPLVMAALLSGTVLAQESSSEILPRDDVVAGLLSGLNFRAEPFTVARGDWNESAGFTVPDEKDVVVHTLVTYVATLSTPLEARDYFQSRARQLELDNEMTHAFNTPRAENLGADESREFRIIYEDIASRSRSAEYARLMRRGSIVGLVEVVGSPEIDDEGQVDEGRRSILLSVSQLLMSRMAQHSIAPTTGARSPLLVTIGTPGPI